MSGAVSTETKKRRVEVFVEVGKWGKVIFPFSPVKAVHYKMDELSEEMIKHLALHGLKQKMSDSLAVPKGTNLSAEEKEEKVQGVWEMLKGGEFTKKRQAAKADPVLSIIDLAKKGLGVSAEGEYRVLSEGELQGLISMGLVPKDTKPGVLEAGGEGEEA